METLAHEFGDALDVWPASTGLHIAAIARADAAEVGRWADRAIAAGVGVHRLAMFGIDREPPPGFALAYGAIATADIPAGVRLLRQCCG